MPLTANGKLDEAAVAALLDANRAPEQPSPATADPAWAVFLELTRDLRFSAPPAAHDTWWGLGGSSLDLMRLAIRASRELDREVPVQLLAGLESIGEIVSAIAAAPPVARTDDRGTADVRLLTDEQAGFLLQHAMDQDDAVLSPMLWELRGRSTGRRWPSRCATCRSGTRRCARATCWSLRPGPSRLPGAACRSPRWRGPPTP
ncbi:phosphopantetheine-binding protein [Catellatospora bangladeshensis]|uniref:phosphopantetheine-binding protein n=1 Tax=Catellatospora bangladeshensis TaxID=310355 RepID=UPI00361357CD